LAATHDIGGAALADEARALLPAGTEALAWRDDDGELHVHPLEQEWTRIGRSLAADVRFDDPEVDRRHALVVRGPDRVRVCDDPRGLLHGEPVGWRELQDGDAVEVGRHVLVFVTA
jgi:pSer/pThr/pTyr-binding forkhead associated (FHA) protein